MQLQVNVKTKGVLNFLKNVEKKQVPYATSQALNSTIFDVRKQIVGPTWDKAFEVRNKRFASASFKVDKATKHKLQAKLHDRLGRAKLGEHIRGTISYKPRGPGKLAVPVQEFRTSSGKIRRNKLPRALPRAFKTRLKSGAHVIAQRRGKAQYPIDVVYLLEREVRLDRRFHFYKDADQTATRAYAKHWEKHFARAVRTAR